MSTPSEKEVELCMCCACVKTDCILGKCKNGCKPLNVTNDLSEQIKANSKKIVTYYVFEKVDTKYFDTKGVEKNYKRTTRVDKRDEFSKVVELLDSCSKSYLLHRYRVTNDNVHWA